MSSVIKRTPSSIKRWLETLLLCSLGLALAKADNSNEWPNWRGPQGNGSIGTGRFPIKWGGDTVAWKVALPGKGTSVPVVHAGRIYLTCPAEGRDTVLAFDFSGKPLWQREIGPESPPKHRTLASSCNASPVTDGKGLFVYFRSGNFAALELDGTVRWQTNLVERFGPDQLFWDQGTSPVVTEKDVIVARMHGGESWVAGFDKESGELRWRESRNYEAPIENNNGYSTPVFFNHEGAKAFLLWGSDHLTAHRADNGKLLWSCDDFNPAATGYWPAIATPVVIGDIAVVPVGRDDRPGQARIHGVSLAGKAKPRRVWQRDDVGVFVTTPAAHSGRVYLLRHRGEVVCMDPATGQTLWSARFPEHRTPYYSSPVIANGILYAAREDGTVFAARVEKEFELLGENPMGERIIACPVPVANRLLIRGDSHLFCVAGAAEPANRASGGL